MAAALSTGYENAPATLLLASFCACCGRPLVDAVSVETGVGPDCREKHGYGEAQLSPDWAQASTFVAGLDPAASPRETCNRLVHAIALDQGGPRVTAYVCAVRALGFVTLADRIAKRLGCVHVHATPDGAELRVDAPYSEAFNAAARAIRGWRGHKEGRTFFRTFPAAARVQVWGAICASFPPGTIVAGDRGFRSVP